MTLLKMSSLFHVNSDAYKSVIFEQFLLKNNILIPLLKQLISYIIKLKKTITTNKIKSNLIN